MYQDGVDFFFFPLTEASLVDSINLPHTINIHHSTLQGPSTHLTNPPGSYHSVPADDDPSPVTLLFQNIPTGNSAALIAEGLVKRS